MENTNKTLGDFTNLQTQLAELVNSTDSLSGFAKNIFDLILTKIPISRVSLSLYDSNTGTITFPYSGDAGERTRPQAFRDINSPLKQVLEKNKALLVDQADFASFCQDKPLDSSIPVIWAGCPVLKGGRAFAALVLGANDKDQVDIIKEIFPALTPFSELLAPYLLTKIELDKLENSESKFRRLAESSADLTFQITSKGYISYVSSNVKPLFGYDPEGLVGKHLKSITPVDQMPKVRKALKTILDGKNIKNMTITQKDSSGSLIPMEINASPIFKDGKVIGVQGTMRDISERHQAQQEIERLAFFPLANPMPVVEVDFYGVPSYINPAGIQLLDRMNLDMAQVAQILPTNFQQDIRDALSDKSTIVSREVSLDGFHLLWSGYFLQNQNLLHYYGTDITTLKNTEVELIDAQKKAVKNEQVKSLFLANMSHEIRTPLNSILGFTELIEEEVKDTNSTDLKAYFDIIRVSGKRLWKTVHEILDISQIESGTFQLKIETIDLSDILNELLISFNHSAEEKNIELQMNIPRSGITIVADEYCATQALSNLIDNAIKYTNSGSVKIDVESSDISVQVIIKDTGIGMSHEYQKQMFDAFSQESTGYTKHFQGVGLGLALSHRYLRMIKSDIQLVSEQDQGSTFTITFPISADIPVIKTDTSMRGAASRNKTNASPGSKPVILVVEDDPNSQKLAELTLQKDFELYFAESVAEAKSQLASNTVQLILLDLSLRGNEDGLDLARYVRKEELLKSIPIIALTAHAFTSDKERCIEVGCDEFITKPYRRIDLLTAMHKLL